MELVLSMYGIEQRPFKAEPVCPLKPVMQNILFHVLPGLTSCNLLAETMMHYLCERISNSSGSWIRTVWRVMHHQNLEVYWWPIAIIHVKDCMMCDWPSHPPRETALKCGIGPSRKWSTNPESLTQVRLPGRTGDKDYVH